jgi:hypothetical protein
MDLCAAALAWFWLKPLVVRLLNKNATEDARDLKVGVAPKGH